MEQDMALASIQAQLANLTSQLTQNAGRTTMPSVPTFGASYGQGYQTRQCPQFSANEDVWGYQGFQANQCPQRDWSDHSNSMWWEAQQIQQGEYWQPYDEFYSNNQSRGNMFSNACNSDWRSNSDYMWDEPQQQQAPSKSLEDLIASLANSTQSHQQKTDKAIESLACQMSQLASLMGQQHQLGRLPNQIVANPDAEQLNAMTLRSEKEILEAIPKVQCDIQILGTPNQVPDCVEVFKEPGTRRRRIPENEVAGEFVEHIQEAVHETIKPKAIEFDDMGQATTIIVNLAKCKVPEMFRDVVFVTEFVSEKENKPYFPILILIFMIQAPTLEFKPLPNHFKYHRPFMDKLRQLNNEGRTRNHPQ